MHMKDIIKNVVFAVLEVFFILFSLFGLLGIAVMSNESDSFGTIVYVVWVVIGAIVLTILFFKSKHYKLFFRHTSKKNKKPNPQSSDNIIAKSDLNNDNNNFAKSERDSDKKEEEKIEIKCPKTKDGAPLAYTYNHQEILDLNFDVAMIAANKNEWELTAELVADQIALYSSGEKIGVLAGKRVDMMRDWLVRKDPYIIYLEGIDSENKKAIAFLAFYKDKRKAMEYREQSVIKLTNYKGSEKQLIISMIDDGSELSLSEEYNEKNGAEYIGVKTDGYEIGKLPKKYMDKYNEEGAEGCFMEKCDYDDYGDLIPYVRIYW